MAPTTANFQPSEFDYLQFRMFNSRLKASQFLDDMGQPQTPDAEGTQMSLRREIKVVSVADVTLKVGKNLKLHVSSLALSLASKVFTAMFKPEWFDRSNISGPGKLPELELPEDDEGTMELLCRLVHFQDEDIARSWADLVNLAVLADKYDCVRAVRHFLNQQVSLLNESSPFLTHRTFAFQEAVIRLVLNDAKGFSSATNALVLNYSGTFRNLEKAKGIDLFPTNFLCMLEERRNHSKMAWMKALSRIFHKKFSFIKVGTLYDKAIPNSPLPSHLQPEAQFLIHIEHCTVSPNLSVGNLLWKATGLETGPLRILVGQSVVDGTEMNFNVAKDLFLAVFDMKDDERFQISLAEVRGAGV